MIHTPHIFFEFWRLNISGCTGSYALKHGSLESPSIVLQNWYIGHLTPICTQIEVFGPQGASGENLRVPFKFPKILPQDPP